VHPLSEALLARFAPALPEGVTLTTSADGRIFYLSSVNLGAAFAPYGALRLPLPRSLKVRAAVEAAMRLIADETTKAVGRPWPASGARAHARAGERVELWYGERPNESLVFPAIPWTELEEQ
jgi:hypothetical protein